VSPLAIGPILALLGVVTVFYVLRGKARSRKSMYRTLREQREHDLKKARARAAAAKAGAEKAAIEKEAAEQAAVEQAAAAAAAPPAVPTSTATITPPAEEAGKPAWENKAAQTPAYTPPPPREPEPVAIEPAVVAAPEPVAATPEVASGDPDKASWEIVQAPDEPASASAGPAAAPAASATSTPKAGWELDTAERDRIDSRHKGGGMSRKADQDEDDEEGAGKEPLAQVILSYLGLVAALLVTLLGILFMIGAKTSS
jgi:hypothetical protein